MSMRIPGSSTSSGVIRSEALVRISLAPMSPSRASRRSNEARATSGKKRGGVRNDEFER